jgi:hypothetical protein
MPKHAASKTGAKMAVKPAADNDLLMCGHRINYGPWRTQLEVDAKALHGNIANIITTGEKYVVPPITNEDWMPVEELEEGVEAAPISAAGAQRLRESAISSRNKEVRKLKDKEAQFYAFIWSRLSVDSAMTIKAHPDFDAAELTNDSTALWNIIVHTHLTHVNGAGAEMTEIIRYDGLKKFNDIRQMARETIGEFITRLKDAYVVLLSAGVPPFTEPEKAIHLLMKLDETRYGSMNADLRNRAQRGEQLPQTLFGAYTIASTFLVKKQQGYFASEEHSIFLADDRSENGRGGRGRGRGGRGARGGRAGRGGRGRGQEDFTETRSCYKCGAVGHISPNCTVPDEEISQRETIAVTTTVPRTVSSVAPRQAPPSIIADHYESDDDQSVTSGAYAYVMTHGDAPPTTYESDDDQSVTSDGWAYVTIHENGPPTIHCPKIPHYVHYEQPKDEPIVTKTPPIKNYVSINGGPCPLPTEWTNETIFLSDAHINGENFDNFKVILDSGATIHAFGNSDLLYNMSKPDQNCSIGGFSDAKQVVLSRKGHRPSVVQQ